MVMPPFFIQAPFLCDKNMVLGCWTATAVAPPRPCRNFTFFSDTKLCYLSGSGSSQVIAWSSRGIIVPDLPVRWADLEALLW